jgi:citrate lyase subunit beta/citryl-CoA lyase
MRMWRSLLFVPANLKKMLDKVGSLAADGFIFDLEDTVPADQKQVAREMARETMAGVAGGRSWVRCNSLATGFIHEDIEAFVGVEGFAGFVVPKVDSYEDSVAVDRMIAGVETRRGLAVGGTPVIAMIESAGGVLDARRIFTVASRIETGIYAGGEDGDMNTSLGATWTSAGPEMMFVRQMTLTAMRAANFECPLDGVYSNVRDHAGFRADTELSRRLGFRGRPAIHPGQIEMANEIYTPTRAQVDYYTRVVSAYREALTRGTASTTVDGKLVDLAMYNTAKRLLDHMESIRELEALIGSRTRQK